MRLTLKKESLNRILIFIVILALFAFGDYSRYVYIIKVVAILGLLFIERNIRIGVYEQWVMSFIAISSLSILWSADRSHSVFYLVWIVQAMALAMAIGNTIHHTEDVEYVLRCFFISGLVLTVRVLLNTSIRDLGTFRLGANMGYNSNELSLKVAIACVSGLYFWNTQRKRYKRALILTGIILLAVTVAFTGSRKGSLMVLMGIVFYNMLTANRPLRFLRNVFISIALVIGFYFLITEVDVLYNVLGRRLLLTLNVFNANSYVGNSIENRLDLISIGVQLFRENPIWGYGIGSFATVSRTNNYAHNNYIELLVDLGIIGTGIYYSLYAFNIVETVRRINTNRALFSILLSFSLILAVLEVGLVTFQGDYAQIIIALCYATLWNRKTVKSSVKTGEGTWQEY